MIDLQVIRETAETVATEAGHLALSYWEKGFETEMKGFRDVVTAADYASQQLIVDSVRARFPAHGFITEEATTDDVAAEVMWIIDPIDGTSNYSRHVPNWCVSIGVAVNDVLAVGAVYDAVRDELFSAVTGQGATVNGAPIHVNETERSDDGIVAFDWSRPPEKRERMRQILLNVMGHARNMRSFGSTTLGMVWIAAGRTDAYFSLMPSIWDVAGATVILREAGGRVSGFAGEPLDIHKRETFLVSTNGRIHDQFLSLLQA